MRKVLLTLLLALGASVAHADNGLLYLGAGIARDNVGNIVVGATDSDLNSTEWKAWAGVRPIRLFAVEADYIDLGSQNFPFSGGNTKNGYKAWAGYAVGFLPIPVPYLDVFGKVGMAHWLESYSNTFPTAGFSVSSSGTEFAWGAGGQVHIGNFGARLEYEAFKISGTNGANVVSLTAFVNLF